MKKYDFVVIGSGLGGLCAAIILAKENKKVLGKNWVPDKACEGHYDCWWWQSILLFSKAAFTYGNQREDY